MCGFQPWVNLPARDKMTATRYQEFAPERIRWRSQRRLPAQTLAVLGGGDLLQLQAGAQGARLLCGVVPSVAGAASAATGVPGNICRG